MYKTKAYGWFISLELYVLVQNGGCRNNKSMDRENWRSTLYAEGENRKWQFVYKPKLYKTLIL